MSTGKRRWKLTKWKPWTELRLAEYPRKDLRISIADSQLRCIKSDSNLAESWGLSVRSLKEMGYKSRPSETWFWSDLGLDCCRYVLHLWIPLFIRSSKRRPTRMNINISRLATYLRYYSFSWTTCGALRCAGASCGHSSKTNRETKGEGNCMLYLWPGYYLCIIHFICMFFTPARKLKININPVYHGDELCTKNIKKWPLTQIKDRNVYWLFHFAMNL